MCEHGDTVILTVPISAEASHTGKFRWALKPIDRCISPYVKALNNSELYTAGSCCGHGKNMGEIIMHNGTIIHIEAYEGECSCRPETQYGLSGEACNYCKSQNDDVPY